MELNNFLIDSDIKKLFKIKVGTLIAEHPVVLDEADVSCPNLTSLQPIHQKEMSWNSALPLENQSEICPMSFLPPPCPTVGAQAQYLWEAKREMLGPKRCRRRREPLSSVSRTSEEIYGTKQ